MQAVVSTENSILKQDDILSIVAEYSMFMKAFLYGLVKSTSICKTIFIDMSQ